VLNVGEPMASPLIRMVKEKIQKKTPLQKVIMKNRTCLKANRHNSDRWPQ
jgi:hypothetical protein